MSKLKELLKAPEYLGPAVTNYETALGLPAQSQVLLVTDRFNRDRISPGSREKHTRFQIASHLYHSLRDKTFRLANFYIDEGKEEGEIAELTRIVLNTLDAQEKGAGDPTTTVVNMAESSEGREAVLAAASQFGRKRKVRLADSTGFNALDGRVMSRLGEQEQSKVLRWYNYFTNFFEIHSSGMLYVDTTDIKEHKHKLFLPFNRKKTPFQNNLGMLGKNNFTTFNGKQIEQEKIPGAGIIIPPQDLQGVDGSFASEGLVFYVNRGYVNAVDVVDDRIKMLSASQQELLNQIQNGAQVPVSALGLGLYGMAGVQTYPGNDRNSPRYDKINIRIGNPPGEKGQPGTGFVCEVPELNLLNHMYRDSYLYSSKLHTNI